MVSVSCFGVRVSVMVHFVFVHYTFSSVWVAEWLFFSSPEPKAHGELIVYRSIRRPCVR